jgi:hypothetical protein
VIGKCSVSGALPAGRVLMGEPAAMHTGHAMKLGALAPFGVSQLQLREKMRSQGVHRGTQGGACRN